MIPLVGWEEKVLVTLTPEEWSQDEAITNAQQERRIAMGHVHGNSRNITREEALLLHFMAMHGERAVHKLFPWLEWHNEVVDYPTGLPDLGNFVDVKAPDQDPTSKIPRRLIAYDNQLHKDWAYVLALFVGLRRFRIMGWAWGEELAAAPVQELQPGRPCHVLDAKIPPLHPVRELQEISLTRHAESKINYCSVCGEFAFHGRGPPLPEPRGFFCKQHLPEQGAGL